MSEEKQNLIKRLSSLRPKIKRSLKGLSFGKVIFWVVTVVLAVLISIFTKSFIASWSITGLPGIPVAHGSEATPAGGGPTATPESLAPEDQLPPPWDGASRVNILFIGLDYGDWSADRSGPSRSDTMILLTIDPLSKTAGMLSIPRDMWVNIPGYGYGKINTAYYLGSAYKLPGGGPGLAMKTVEQFMGVPVQYYAQIDFNAFVDMIDTIGGIDVMVEDKSLVLDPIGTGMDHVILTKGLRHLSGWKALAYARIRKQTKGGDVDRARRQQQVIMAIRNKVFDPENFTNLVLHAQELYYKFAWGIHTNISFEDALRLAVLVQKIPKPPTYAPVARAGWIIFSGGTIAAGGTCKVTVDVTAANGGAYYNTSGAVRSTNAGTGNTASDMLTVPTPLATSESIMPSSIGEDKVSTMTGLTPPVINKSFSPNPIGKGGVSTLSFTINNPNPTTALTGVAFLDDFPAGMVVAKPTGAGTTGCGTEYIKMGVIDFTMVTLDNVTVNGQNQEIFKPMPDQIRVLRDEIFTSSGALSPLASGDPVTLMKADAARVRVLNGSGVGGVEARTYNYLGSLGMGVVEANVADRGYSNTVIVLYSGKLYTLQYLVTQLRMINSASQIRIESDPASTVDVEIRLGSDWVSKIPPGF